MKKIVWIISIVLDRITKDAAEDLTQNEISRITDEEIKRITEQKTREITEQIMGGSAGIDDNPLKQVECDLTPKPREFDSTPYYNGQLIDAHLHMPFTFEVPSSIYQQADWDPPILEKEVASSHIICIFDKAKISSAFGFYAVPNLLKGTALSPIKRIDKQHIGRITPFLMPTHVSGLELEPNEVEEILNSNKGLFKGYGEIGMYKGVYKGVSPDDPSLIDIYKIADKNNLIVMMHPDDGQQAAIERILKQYPNVRFLFHGHQMRDYAADIVSKYPNAYYTIDGDLNDIPGEHQSVNLYGDKEKEVFISKFKRDY